MKIRVLAIACTAGALLLTGCQTKVGTAAIVNGDKISESTLAGYLTPDAKPLQSSNGTGSIAPRTFVLQYLIRSKIFERVLSSNGFPVTDALLNTAKSQALSGSTEDDLTKQVTAIGLSPSFEPVALRYDELYNLIGTKFDAGSDNGARANAALTKTTSDIKVNPRYGSWDAKTLSLADLSKAQLPSFLQFDTTLPGDAPPSQ
ncbi:MAG TPA: hypothetical protein VHO01_16830 [Jatrophihabitans sp.]|nr:hypothetical protein [Jatrophihabitans sp.]